VAATADNEAVAPEAVSGLTGRAEESLVDGFVSGDAGAFDEVVRMHQTRVARMVHRLLGWPGDVDDVVQEVFLAAWRHRRKFRGGSSLATWLTAIAVNKCRSHERRRVLGRFWRSWQEVRAGEAGAPAEDSPLVRQETAAAVRRAVEGLPPRCREVVVLRYLEDMPVSEVAVVLGISANAAQVRLARAKDRLHTLLGHLVKE
jgi:RNA polymerase sigma factor (sigma-70 family)